MIDQELLNACVINSWSVTPRMMLIDSMIENGYSEFKALEAFEPPTVSRHLPSIYVGCGVGSGYGGNGSGNVIDGGGNGSGSCYGFGGGYIIDEGDGNGRGRRGYENSNGYRDDKLLTSEGLGGVSNNS